VQKQELPNHHDIKQNIHIKNMHAVGQISYEWDYRFHCNLIDDRKQNDRIKTLKKQKK
jgi:hypothetical protein